jgi:hypothetical protein
LHGWYHTFEEEVVEQTTQVVHRVVAEQSPGFICCAVEFVGMDVTLISEAFAVKKYL